MYLAVVQENIVPEPVGINFFTDASIIAADLPEAQILLFGPGEPFMAHKPNEYVDLEKYVKAIHIFRHLIEDSFLVI